TTNWRVTRPASNSEKTAVQNSAEFRVSGSYWGGDAHARRTRRAAPLGGGRRPRHQALDRPPKAPSYGTGPPRRPAGARGGRRRGGGGEAAPEPLPLVGGQVVPRGAPVERARADREPAVGKGPEDGAGAGFGNGEEGEGEEAHPAVVVAQQRDNS